MGVVGRSVLDRRTIDRGGVRGRRGGHIGSRVNCLLQSPEFGRRERATFPRTVQILEGDGRGIYPRRFILFRIAGGERNLDRRVIDSESSLDVLNQSLWRVRKKQRVRDLTQATHGDVNVRGWRTRTRNLNWLSIGPIHSTVAISSSSRVKPSGKSQRRRKSRDSCRVRSPRLPLEH